MSVEFDNKISLGHMLSVGAIAVAGLVAFFDLRGDTQQLASEVATIRQDAGQIKQNAGNSESRIRAVEIAQASQTSDLRSIQIGITEIKTALSRMQEGKP